MNTWQLRKTAIVEADDFQDKYDRNGLEMLFYWKAKYPKFKITLFTIPNKTSKEMLSLIHRNYDWINLAVHGFNHDSNFECWEWDYQKTKDLIDRTAQMGKCFETRPDFNIYKPIFKAPGWMITDKTAGYVADESLPISKDPQGVYRALKEMDFIVVDRHYNKDARIEGGKYICIDCQPKFIHSHTWDMITGDRAEKNGLRQIEELHGCPWNNETEFYFISEAWDKGLILPCKN